MHNEAKAPSYPGHTLTPSHPGHILTPSYPGRTLSPRSHPGPWTLPCPTWFPAVAPASPGQPFSVSCTPQMTSWMHRHLAGEPHERGFRFQMRSHCFQASALFLYLMAPSFGNASLYQRALSLQAQTPLWSRLGAERADPGILASWAEEPRSESWSCVWELKEGFLEEGALSLDLEG